MRKLLVISFSAIATLSVSAFAAEAQVITKDATCRSGVWYAAAKVATKSLKAITSCTVNVLKGKLATSTDCFDLTAIEPALAAYMWKGVKTHCQEVPNQAALARYTRCPSPAQASDDGEISSGIDSFAEVSSCQTALNTGYATSLQRYVLRPDAAAVQASPESYRLVRCAGTIGKGAATLWLRAAKRYAACQRIADSAGEPYEYGTSASFQPCINEADAKLAYDASKLAYKLTYYCGPLSSRDLGLLGSCAASAAGIAECATAAVFRNVEGLTANAFEHAGQCPSEVRLVTRPGNFEGGRISATRIDAGWTGLAHEGEFFDGFAMRLALQCSTPECNDCGVSASCAEGNCRCSDDPSVACDTPFTSGGSCGAATCVLQFGPPRPRSIGGVPICLTEAIETPLDGVTDVGTGTMTLSSRNTQRIHAGISQTQPCPRCTGATIGASGTCNGGTRDTLPCVTHALDPDFGPTSYDCPPTAASNLSGPTGITLDIELTDADTSLTASQPCDVPIQSLNCHCGACSGDPTVACTGHDTCAQIGAGTCGAGSGAARDPNSCLDLVCTAADGAQALGLCAAGPEDDFCDGLTRANGEGYVNCLTDSDCSPVGAGQCSQHRNRRCFLPTIERSGLATPSGGTIGWVGCVPPAQVGSVNAALGLPGPARRNIAFHATHFCADGTTPFALGGSLCP